MISPSDSTTIPVVPTTKPPHLVDNIYGVCQPETSPSDYLDAWLLKPAIQRGQLGHGIRLETTMSTPFFIVQLMLTAAYASTSPGHLQGRYLNCNGLWIVPPTDPTTIRSSHHSWSTTCIVFDNLERHRSAIWTHGYLDNEADLETSFDD